MIKVNLRYQKVSPKKAILVSRLISGMRLVDAKDQLINLNKKSATGYLSLVKQIEAIAKTKGIDIDKLYITQSICQQAPMLKRRIISGRGHANRILKRMSHFSITADIKEEKVVEKTVKVNKKVSTKSVEKKAEVKEEENGTKS